MAMNIDLRLVPPTYLPVLSWPRLWACGGYRSSLTVVKYYYVYIYSSYVHEWNDLPYLVCPEGVFTHVLQDREYISKYIHVLHVQ